MYRCVIAASDVEYSAASGNRKLQFPAGAIVTPLARDRARELGVTLEETGADPGNGPGAGTVATVGATMSPDQERVRRVVTRVLLESFPSLFNPAWVGAITRLIMIKLGDGHGKAGQA